MFIFFIFVFSSKEDLFYPFPSFDFFLCIFKKNSFAFFFFLIFWYGLFFSFLFGECGRPRDFCLGDNLSLCYLKKVPNNMVKRFYFFLISKKSAHLKEKRFEIVKIFEHDEKSCP